ncbi:hypothetical protein TNCV_1221971 [Trichonephila clavipes]|nr:hypothetical protein TNCV_1221971 [Trichonephila clavipes]
MQVFLPYGRQLLSNSKVPEVRKGHLTKECEIKGKQKNPFCINCKVCKYTASYTKCPKFSKPKKGTPLNLNENNFSSNNVIEGISFANKGNIKSSNSNENNSKTEQNQSYDLSTPETNISQVSTLNELSKILSGLVKKNAKVTATTLSF